jgi:hypothetical protein
MAYRPLASSFAEGIGSNEFHTASGDVCPVAINVFPAGSIPACRPVTYTKMIICSIDPSLVSELSAESDLAVTLIQGSLHQTSKSYAKAVAQTYYQTRSNGNRLLQ